MLTKIIFRACILVVLTTLFACVPDESAMPKVEADALLMTNETANLQPLENAHARIISQENQPTACIYEDCSTLLPALYATYRDLANETCKEQWYCATCCLEDQITEIQAYVEPDSENCLAAVGQDVASALPIPNLTVAILPNHCLMGGTMLGPSTRKNREPRLIPSQPSRLSGSGTDNSSAPGCFCRNVFAGKT